MAARCVDLERHDNAGRAWREQRYPVDILVANTGALDLLSINTLGPLRVAQAFLRQVRRGENPRIILMSSRLGSMAVDGAFNVAYRASKAGLNRIAQCLAADLAPEGVCVIALHPGWVRTDMGGPAADIGVEESAAGVIRVYETLTLRDTGRFLDYRGEALPW